MASGRLGYKCVPPYSACEIYVNSSGSPASVTVSSQVNSPSDSSKFSLGVTTGAITLQSSTNVLTGTNCFCQAIGFNFYPDGTTSSSDEFKHKPCATYIRGPENCYSRINKYMNSTTTTCGANLTRPAPYGGNEVILPSDGTQIPTVIGAFYPTESIKCVFLGVDCTGCFPHVITDKAYCSNQNTAAQIFTNPYCNCGCTCAGFSLATYGFCSIEYTACVYKGYCGIDAFVVNNYSHAFGNANLPGCTNYCTRSFFCCCACCGICNCGTCYCCIEQCSQDLCCGNFEAIAIGLSCACNGCCGGVIYYNKFSTIVNTCPTVGCACCIPFSPCICCYSLVKYGYGTLYVDKHVNGLIPFVTNCTTCQLSTCWCNNTTCGNAMSPYGVQRAATKCALVWAFCNGVDCDRCYNYQCCCMTSNPLGTISNKTGYFIGYPGGFGCGGCVADSVSDQTCYHGAFGSCSNYLFNNVNPCLLYTLGMWVTIESPHCCEYPIKYVSYDPKADRSYLMIRSSTSWKTGIYVFGITRSLTACKPPNCTTCILAYHSMPVLCQFNGICTEEYRKCSWGAFSTNYAACRVFCRVADFPEIMLCQKYINPFMCVTCIFKTKSDMWTLGIYNHCTSKWDPFVTNDLIKWCNPGNEGIFDFTINDNSRYLVNNSCLELRTNTFDDNIPKCAIIDYDVNANNLERTGLVISNGDRLVVNNKGSVSASVQVWGYEG